MNYKVLVACEKSKRVREAFNQYHGFHAISCDILPAEGGNDDYHYQGDIRHILYEKWDILIAFPPCTRLCNSGRRWIGERNLWQEMEEAAEFFNLLLNANHIPYRRIENPIQSDYARQRIVKYDQIIHPWMFGEGYSKSTCLWNRNLPNLIPTNIVDGRKQAVHEMSPSKHRSEDRSRTYIGIAQAIAKQTVEYIVNKEKE